MLEHGVVVGGVESRPSNQQPYWPAAGTPPHADYHSAKPGCSPTLYGSGSTRSSDSSNLYNMRYSHLLQGCTFPAYQYGSRIAKPIPNRPGLPARTTQSTTRSWYHIPGRFHAGLCNDFDRIRRKDNNRLSCRDQRESSRRRENCDRGETFWGLGIRELIQ